MDHAGMHNCMLLGIESSTFAILIAVDEKELIRMVLHHTEYTSKETYSKAKYEHNVGQNPSNVNYCL